MQNEIPQKNGGWRRFRKSHAAGHCPKFLVLIDETDDCGKAVYYASRRAVRLGAKVSFLRIIAPPQSETPFLGVAEMMKAVAEEEARQLLARWAELAHAVAREPPETLIEYGDTAVEIFKIEADEDLAMLVLAAGCSKRSGATHSGTRPHCRHLSPSGRYRTGASQRGRIGRTVLNS
jgi:nucleotide-binding universal stress UspA family protein